jgi:hypothetical protein
VDFVYGGDNAHGAAAHLYFSKTAESFLSSCKAQLSFRFEIPNEAVFPFPLFESLPMKSQPTF